MMNIQRRNFLLFATLAAAAATPALGQDAAPAVGAASSATQSAASIPDFSRIWSNSLGPGFSPPAWRLYRSDLAAVGGGSREEARRNRVKRRPCSESDQPVQAQRGALRLL